MKKLHLLLLAVSFTWLLVWPLANANAQGVGINPSGNPPDPSAVLDASASDKGVLIPRVSLLSITDITTISNPAVSLLVYNTNELITLGDGTGFYYWDGSQWSPVGGSSSPCAVPVTPGAISGTSSPCWNAMGVTYSISPVANATSYTWTVPAGATVANGQGNTAITVNLGTSSGNVCVTANNTCGSSTSSCFPVILYAPPLPIANTPTNVTSTSFIASWSAVAAGVTAYYLDVATDASFTNFVAGYNNLNVGDVTTYTVTGLTVPACSDTPAFYYRVRAGNSCGISVSSPVISCYSSTPLWTQIENPTASGDYIYAMTRDASGVFVAGGTRIQKRNLSTGAIIWTQTSSSAFFSAITIDATGIYVAGSDNVPGNAQWRIEKRNLSTGALITSFGTSGVITQNPSSSNSEQITSIAADASGLYVAGYDNVAGTGGEWRIEKRNLSTGALITSFGSSGIITENLSTSNDQIQAIALDATGLYVAGGDWAPGNLQWRIEKRDLSTGGIIWTQTNNPSSGASSNEQVYAIALDATGIYAAGADYIGSSTYGRMEKRDLNSGAVIWTQRDESYVIIYGVAPDANFFYVTGQGKGNGKWATEKRDLSTGAMSWINNKTLSTNDEIHAIALDATGVYVAGYDGIISSSDTEWRIEKYCK